MSLIPQRMSLTARTALILMLAFVILQAAVLGMFWLQVARPLALQAADDLAARLVLAAQTWVELPPQTRPDFESELSTRHAIRIDAEAHLPTHALLQHSLDVLVAEALSRRTGQAIAVRAADDPERAETDMTISTYQLRMSFPRPQALSRAAWLIVLVFVGGSALTVAMAVLLTRRTAARLRNLAGQAAAVGRGQSPSKLPESGEKELAELTATLNRLVGEVQGLLENRTVLLAGISHDLRTPLTRLRLAVSLLEGADPARVARIEAEIREMDALISDMLALARDLKTEDSTRIVWGDWLERHLANWKPDTVTFSVEGAPSSLVAEAALRRILMNLVENALRYGQPAEGAQVPVEVQVRVDDRGWALAVLDHGPGIPESEREAVMRPFHRLEVSRGRHSGGAGLGLAIAHQLAEAHGWTIRLDSRPGGGLIAWVFSGA